MYLFRVEYGSITSIIILAVFYMLIPAIAVIIVQKFIYKHPLGEYGFTFKNISVKHLLLTPVFYLAFVFLATGIVFLFGNILHIDGFGVLTFLQENINANIEKIINGRTDITKLNIPAPEILFFLCVFGGIFSGLTMNLLFTFGEEFGWRGLLLKETQYMGFWKSNFLIGFIWGIWHAPIILMGHNYPGYPIAGVGMMILFCISLSFLQAYLRLRSKTILAPSAFHGMLNAGAPAVLICMINYNPLIGSIAGAAGILSAIIITAVILLCDREFISEYKEL